MELGPYRWTLTEYLLRCEPGGDIREVVVEGELDRVVMEDAIRRWKTTANVLDAAYIHVTDEEIRAAGHQRGIRGALLTVAKELDALPDTEPEHARVIVVVNRDYDPPPEGDHLAVTDGYSIESYSCSREALDRFITFVLGRSRLPEGSGHRRPPRRHTCSGEDLLSRVMPAAQQVAAVRLVLRELERPPAVFDHWADYAVVSPDGQFTLDGADLLRNILVSSGREDEWTRRVPVFVMRHAG